jgi:hypothetical protein
MACLRNLQLTDEFWNSTGAYGNTISTSSNLWRVFFLALDSFLPLLLSSLTTVADKSSFSANNKLCKALTLVLLCVLLSIGLDACEPYTKKAAKLILQVDSKLVVGAPHSVTTEGNKTTHEVVIRSLLVEVNKLGR